MSDVKAHYEAFPNRARDPANETKHLVTGFPTDPRELDYYFWGRQRNWSRPLRVLGVINGRRSLAEIANGTGTDPMAFQTQWAKVEAALCGWGLMLYFDLLKG